MRAGSSNLLRRHTNSSVARGVNEGCLAGASPSAQILGDLAHLADAPIETNHVHLNSRRLRFIPAQKLCARHNDHIHFHFPATVTDVGIASPPLSCPLFPRRPLYRALHAVLTSHIHKYHLTRPSHSSRSSRKRDSPHSSTQILPSSPPRKGGG